MISNVNNPYLSILVPVCNVEKYVKECLNSLLNQTFNDIEIICIDDGSTDTSGAILDEYALNDARVHVIHKKNTGYGNSMNVALQNSRGMYIGIVEPDDYVDPDMFEKLISLAREHEAEVVKSKFYVHNSQKADVDVVSKTLDRVNIYEEVIDPLEHPEIFRVSASIWTSVYRRDFLEENEIKFLESPGASFQDTAFAFKVWSKARRVVLTDNAYLHYRVTNSDSSSKSPGKVFCICDEFKEAERYILEHCDEKEKLLYILDATKFGSYKWNLRRVTFGFKYAFLLRMSQEFKEDRDNGRIDESCFYPNELPELHMVIDDPDEYYRTECCKVIAPYETVEMLAAERKALAKTVRSNEKVIHKLEAKNEGIENSVSYRLGRGITFIPRTVKNVLHRSAKEKAE